jgi:hypothetical protein
VQTIDVGLGVEPETTFGPARGTDQADLFVVADRPQRQIDAISHGAYLMMFVSHWVS